MEETKVGHSTVRNGKSYGMRAILPSSCMNVIRAGVGDGVRFTARGRVATLSRSSSSDSIRISQVAEGTSRISLPISIASSLGVKAGDSLAWYVCCTGTDMSVEVEKR